MVESLCLHVMVTGLKPMECILLVVVFFFFKGPAHILLNIIKAKPNPVHIRALRVQPIQYGFCLILLRPSPAQFKLSLLIIKLYRAKFIRPSPNCKAKFHSLENIAQTKRVVFNLQKYIYKIYILYFKLKPAYISV